MIYNISIFIAFAFGIYSKWLWDVIFNGKKKQERLLDDVEKTLNTWARKTFMYNSSKVKRGKGCIAVTHTGPKRWNIYKKDFDELMAAIKTLRYDV
jgi:hypothetical protein